MPDRAAKASENASFTGVPSGFVPSRAKSNTSKSPIPAASNASRILGRIAAVEDQHRETLARSQKVAVEGAERKRTRAVRHDLFGLGDFEHFDVAILQLHDAVVRAPGMAVARADGEAGARIEFRRRVEIADGVHDVVETVGHPTSLALGAGHFTDENEVGTSN